MLQFILFAIQSVVCVFLLSHLNNARKLWSELSPLERAKVSFVSLIYIIIAAIILAVTSVMLRNVS